MNSLNQVIESIKSDNMVKAFGFYGSYADDSYSNQSDIDIFVILDKIPSLSVEGIHFQSFGKKEFDFLLISEDLMHERSYSAYLELCLLRKSKVLYSNCDICSENIKEIKNSNKERGISDQESENITWHLQHILLKASKSNSDVVATNVLWAKFIYFLSLLWPRFYNLEVQSELQFIKHSYGEKLKSFIFENQNKIPPIQEWINFLSDIPSLKRHINEEIFCEANGMIQPFTPIVNYQDKTIYKKRIKKWLAI